MVDSSVVATDESVSMDERKKLMGEITHPLPSSLPLSENIVAVDETVYGVGVDNDADLEVAADVEADAGIKMPIY